MAPQASRWRVRLGGLALPALMAELAAQQVQLNAMALSLLQHPAFPDCQARAELSLVAVTVAELGFPQGATLPSLLAQALACGLRCCPLQTAPFFRLQYLDQTEDPGERVAIKGQAPPGALTVMSVPLDPRPDVPKGFYLRKAEGRRWLRAYCSDDLHVWNAHDGLVFAE